MSAKDGINSFGGGFDTSRLGAAEADRVYRQAQQAAARKALAAIVCDQYGIDPFQARPGDLPAQLTACRFWELAEILGLEGSREPGYCACGAVLAMMTVTAQGAYHHGKCLPCSKGGAP